MGAVYSDVGGACYQEIPENVYSQVPEEELRPHRPAPTTPSLLGQPISMQQIQRKIQQGQVRQIELQTYDLDKDISTQKP